MVNTNNVIIPLYYNNGIYKISVIYSFKNAKLKK
ncbi:hypothetical protein C8E17_1814 [Serratia plymuthica]|nr:hypothetical protein C8E17_1814 [Serratia plymuthica]CAI1818754.1 Uncharacterised protein [Serratia plymuthica]CAI2500434.1 Uncharacterised protein [Serratia plymuthica]